MHHADELLSPNVCKNPDSEPGCSAPQCRALYGRRRRQYCRHGEVPTVSTSAAKKQRGVLDEQFWILEQGAMARVRVKDELSVRQVLCKYVGVDRWDHDVSVAVHDENRLFDLPQTRVAP